MSKNQRNRSKQLLVDILQTGGMLTVAVIAPGALPALKPFMKNGKLDRSDFNRTLKRLYKNDLISTKEENGKMTLILEEKGKEKAIKYSIDDISIKEPKKMGWQVAHRYF